MAVDPKIKQKAEDIRTKVFGSEVRESLASGLEGMSEDVESIKGRQGNVENQFQDVLDETTGKDVISAPELIAARNGKSNLKTRLDDEHAQVTAQLLQTEQELSSQLAHTMTQAEFNHWVNMLTDGSPSVYANSLAELEANYPNGNNGIALVKGTDNANIFIWDGSAWKDFGVYQGAQIQTGSVALDDLSIVNKKNMFTEYEKGISLVGSSVGPAQALGNHANAISVIIPVQPNVEYSIFKEPSDRFRIATFENEPTYNADVKRYVKDKEDLGESHFFFKTLDNENYVMVTVSLENQRPELYFYKSDKIKQSEHLMVAELDLETNNLVKSKNIFKNDYINGYLSHTDNYFYTAETDRVAVVKVEPLTTYTISKTPSNRFRVALSSTLIGTEKPYTAFKKYIKTTGDDDESYTFTTGLYDLYLYIYVASNSAPPSFIQVEKGEQVTEWETFGYKVEPFARKYSDLLTGGVVKVEDYRQAGRTDAEVLQKAFDEASRSVVELGNGVEYVVNETIQVDLSKVVGIIGNNAKIIGNVGSGKTLELLGNFTSGNAMPDHVPLNIYDEMNTFVRDLKVTSYNAYESGGIYYDGTFSINTTNVHVYKTKIGLEIGSFNRNPIFSGLHIYDNAEDGILFNKSNLHQVIITNSHISYNLNNIRFVGGNLANIQIIGNSLENGPTPAFDFPESIIAFEHDENGNGIFEVVIIDGNNIQDHNMNIKPIINIDLNEDQMHDLTITGGQIGNARIDNVQVLLKGVNGGVISGVTITSFPIGKNSTAILLEGVNKYITINGCHLDAGIDWTNSTITKLSITGNVMERFTLSDSNDGNVLVANNL